MQRSFHVIALFKCICEDKFGLLSVFFSGDMERITSADLRDEGFIPSTKN